MSEQKEFKIGDEVWFKYDGRITGGLYGGIVWENQHLVQGFEELETFMSSQLFHTPEELIENIKQQIDEMDK